MINTTKELIDVIKSDADAELVQEYIDTEDQELYETSKKFYIKTKSGFDMISEDVFKSLVSDKIIIYHNKEYDGKENDKIVSYYYPCYDNLI